MADATGNDVPIGRQLRKLRVERGLSQQALAELVGWKSGSAVSMIESGERSVERRSTLEALAFALRVAPTELDGRPYPPSDAASRAAHASIEAIRRALTATDVGDRPTGEPRPIVDLGDGVARLNRSRQACDFAAVGEALPALITDLHAHLPGAGRHAAAAGLVACYEAARAAAKHLGATDLGVVAARSVRDAANVLGGPEWEGLAAWSRAQAIGSSARGRALDVVTAAVDDIEPHIDEPHVGEIYGMLHLIAAHSANTLGDTDTADAHLAEADAAAARYAGDFAELHFGPTNVAVWRVMISVERRDEGRAVDLARSVDPEQLPPSGERQAAFWLDTGRGLAVRRKTQAQAVEALRQAEQMAPQRIRVDPFAREVVRDLRRQWARRGTVGRELAGMAHRMGIAA